MGLLDYVASPRQAVAYMFPETTFADAAGVGGGTSQLVPDGGTTPTAQLEDVFVFQFWPQQVQDNYTPNYATKNIPGASHPIYQYTSGNGRDISFTAQFVSELREDQGFSGLKNSDFRSRLVNVNSVAGNNTSALGGQAALGNAVGSLMLPSARYTVNVRAALAALQQYLYPTYGQNNDGPATPPKKLVLVLPGTSLGRSEGDGILCIMRSASVTQEAWFPNGEIRAASVALKFSEIVQFSTSSVSKIKYIGAEKYTALAKQYASSVKSANELTLG